MTHELTFKAWHHGYLGAGLLVLGFVIGSTALKVIGAVILIDDVVQHTVQYFTQSEWQSPLKRLYGYIYPRVPFIRAINRFLDNLFGKHESDH